MPWLFLRFFAGDDASTAPVKPREFSDKPSEKNPPFDEKNITEPVV